VSAPPSAARLLDPTRRRTTVGLVVVVTLVAFEAMAVTTVLPAAADELGGIRLYGWAFTAFFLAELLGIALSGQQVDRHGPARPFLVGLVAFGGGLVVAGVAPSMPVLVLGRAVQGYGAGAVSATVYVLIRHAYDDRLRPRVMAVTSSAWIVPSLVGPAVGGAVAEQLHWRLVFLGVAPWVVPVVLWLAPVLRQVGPPASTSTDRGRLRAAFTLVAGVGLLLAGAQPVPSAVRGTLVVAGLLMAVPAARSLLPAGTLRYRSGLPAAIAARAVLTMAFFGGEAFIPLALTDVRGLSMSQAGLAVTFGALGWSAGSWVQERLDGRASRAALTSRGLVLLAVGMLGVSMTLSEAVPAVCAAAAWTVAGGGMGVAYSSVSLLVLAAAPAGREGATTAALQLSDVLGALAGTGLGGALVATSTGSEVAAPALLALFGALTVVALGGAALGRRLPGGRSGPAGAVVAARSPSTVAV
jgi:MFS family permease